MDRRSLMSVDTASIGINTGIVKEPW